MRNTNWSYILQERDTRELVDIFTTKREALQMLEVLKECDPFIKYEILPTREATIYGY